MSSMDDKFEQMDKAFLLYSQGKTVPQEVPAGWFTAAEFAKHKGYSHYHANRLLRKLRQDGKVEIKKFAVHTANDAYYPIPHYKIIDGKEEKKTTKRLIR